MEASTVATFPIHSNFEIPRFTRDDNVVVCERPTAPRFARKRVGRYSTTASPDTYRNVRVMLRMSGSSFVCGSSG